MRTRAMPVVRTPAILPVACELKVPVCDNVFELFLDKKKYNSFKWRIASGLT